MKNLQLISTSYRIRDLAEVGFAFGRRIKGFSIDIKETEINAVCGYKRVRHKVSHPHSKRVVNFAIA